MKVLKPKKTKMILQHKAGSTLVYAWTIVFIISAGLFMQNYYKRSFQGMLQGAADNIGKQYASGKTNDHSHQEHSSTTVEVKTAGLNNPTLITLTWGKASGYSQRKIESLDETWPK